MNEMPFTKVSKKSTTIAPPCIFVIFGVSGDLTKRLLMPAIYNLFNEGLLNQDFAILGINRSDPDEEQFRADLIASVREIVEAGSEARSPQARSNRHRLAAGADLPSQRQYHGRQAFVRPSGKARRTPQG